MKNIFIGFIVSLLFLSCKNKQSEPLRVGVILWPANEFFYLAENLGYYKDQHIKLIDYRTPSEVIRAYETGLLDAILITDHLYLKINDANVNNRIIMLVDYSSGSDVLLAKPGITTTEELKGKKIGAESSALGIFVMLRFLEIHGLSPDDITHVPVDVANQPQAFKNGLFDAIITYEPFATEMRKKGAIELCNSKEIPFEISDVLISSPMVIAQKSAQLEVLCQGFFDAVDVYQKDPAKYISKLSRRQNITSKEFSKTLQGITLLNLNDNKKLFKSTNAGYYNTFSEVNKKMIDYNLIDTKHNITELIDTRIINNIHAKN